MKCKTISKCNLESLAHLALGSGVSATYLPTHKNTG